MNHQVDMQRATGLRWDSILKTIVQASPSINRVRRQEAHPLEDAEDVHVDGEYLAIETVHHHATCALPRQPMKAEKGPFSIVITQVMKAREGETTGLTTNLAKQRSNRSSLLAVQATGAKYCGDGRLAGPQ